MNAADIRDLYREFFVARGHLVGEPAGLVPAGDTSVLFTTAGMQQYKRYFLGVETPPAKRITTCQRTFRTSDVENVGKTARHLTFFEMLGNFSFGDYFKAEAIAWSLEFSAQLGIDRDRLWVTVFGGNGEVPADEEAIALWRGHGVPAERIVELGRSDNFWGPAGPSGPCGPCSELYYDMGEGVGCGRPDCKPGCDCDRYMEYWNLVFPQYDMDEKGALAPLPRPSIDTGMGIERIAAITQGATTVFESDAFDYLIAAGERLSGVRYGSSAPATRALRTMADHARGVSFLVMDGVLPGNEGRDYVLRRIIRRAVQQGVSIGMDSPFMARLCDLVVEKMAGAYPALGGCRAAISQVAEDEERRFRRTLEQGTHILEEALRRAKDTGEELPAEVAFELHDTYGFPFDLTREMALEAGMGVDEEQFERLMTEQRERARTARRSGWGEGPSEVDAFQRDTAAIAVDFVGYEKLEVFTAVLACRTLSDGRVALKLAESPFYAEGGGQVCDEGWIHTEEGAKLEVDDVVRFGENQVVVARLLEGAVERGNRAKAMVNAVRRHQTACNHTATHLLHNALRLLVDGAVRQAGSMVSPSKLRFDFTIRRAPTKDELRRVEDLVNRRIVESHPVRAFVTTREYAAELGALAFFEEKYGDTVRVLEIDDFSRELCGGTHVTSTSQIGLFKLTSSQSVGANTRRIEAITSAKAIEHFRGAERLLEEAAAALRTDPERVPAALAKQAELLRELEQRLKKTESGQRSGALAAVLGNRTSVAGVPVVIAKPTVDSAQELLTLADEIRARVSGAVVILAAEVDGRVAAVVALDDSAVGRGLHAQEILRTMMPAVEGRGGGKPTLARGGGPMVAGIAAALDAGLATVTATLAGNQ